MAIGNRLLRLNHKDSGSIACTTDRGQMHEIVESERKPRSPYHFFLMVGEEGLEPTPREGLEPKSSASTSSATRPREGDKDTWCFFLYPVVYQYAKAW